MFRAADNALYRKKKKHSPLHTSVDLQCYCCRLGVTDETPMKHTIEMQVTYELPYNVGMRIHFIEDVSIGNESYSIEILTNSSRHAYFEQRINRIRFLFFFSQIRNTKCVIPFRT